MTREAVSLEEEFHWTKFLAFKSQKFLSLKCFMKAEKQFNQNLILRYTVKLTLN